MARFVFVWVFFCGAPVKKRSSKVIKAYARTLLNRALTISAASKKEALIFQRLGKHYTFKKS